jgi:hypothetical protein
MLRIAVNQPHPSAFQFLVAFVVARTPRFRLPEEVWVPAQVGNGTAVHAQALQLELAQVFQ